MSRKTKRTPRAPAAKDTRNTIVVTRNAGVDILRVVSPDQRTLYLGPDVQRAIEAAHRAPPGLPKGSLFYQACVRRRQAA